MQARYDDPQRQKRTPAKVTWAFVEIGPMTWTLIQGLLIAAKLSGDLSWSWMMVLTPALVGLAVLVVLFVAGIVAGVREAKP